MPPLVVFAPGSIVPVQDALRDAYATLAPEIQLVHPPKHSGLLAQILQAPRPTSASR